MDQSRVLPGECCWCLTSYYSLTRHGNLKMSNLEGIKRATCGDNGHVSLVPVVLTTPLLFHRAAHSCHEAQAQSPPAQAHPPLHVQAQQSCPSPLNTRVLKELLCCCNRNSHVQLPPPDCECLKSRNRPLWSWPWVLTGSSLTNQIHEAITHYLLASISRLIYLSKDE